jgi:hypothetical protein
MNDVAVSASRPWLVLALVATIGILVSPDASAQWKWRDSGGRVTVSDTPPPRDVADKDILQRPSSTVGRRAQAASAPPTGASAVVATPAPNPLEAEVEARKRKVEEEQKAKQKAVQDTNAAARAENCNRAKSQLRTLEDGIRLARTNEKGRARNPRRQGPRRRDAARERDHRFGLRVTPTRIAQRFCG